LIIFCGAAGGSSNAIIQVGIHQRSRPTLILRRHLLRRLVRG
jgi:hypothetical protein